MANVGRGIFNRAVGNMSRDGGGDETDNTHGAASAIVTMANRGGRSDVGCIVLGRGAEAQRPAHYLAIPPELFAAVIERLGAANLADQARVIVEKPFGRDLASARKLDADTHSVFPEDAIFRIDHYLGKEEIMNILYFRFANSFLEPILNRNYIGSVQITLAERFGVHDRGAFYETAGCLRDLVQNHMFQIVALLAMEPPVDRNYGAVHTEKAKVFEAMRPLTSRDLVCGQYAGYRKVPHVAKDSDIETYCALRLFIDSWRWEGVPWYVRSGKCLPETGALFTREDAVEATWAVVDKVLKLHSAVS